MISARGVGSSQSHQLNYLVYVGQELELCCPSFEKDEEVFVYEL